LIKRGFLFGIYNDSDNGRNASITSDSKFLECSADSGGAYFDFNKSVRFQGCMFEKCSAKKKGGAGMALCQETDFGYNEYYRIYKCDFIENIAPDGNGLWMSNFNCRGLQDDIVQSRFHKCSTNHNHDFNAVWNMYTSCSLGSQNTFTE